MGQLSGFDYRETTKRLKRFGFELFRQSHGSHEVWRNPSTARFTTIPHHRGDIPEGTLRAILKQAGITPEQFLEGVK